MQLERFDNGVALERLADALSPHLRTVQKQILRTPGSLLRRVFLARAANWMSTGDSVVTLRRQMFFGRALAFPFPACWDLFVYGTYIDEAELRLERFLLRRLRPGDVVVDVGANVGFFSLLAACLVGPSGRVVAVEPCPATLAYLRRNLADAGNTDIVDKALVAEGTRVTFHEARGGAVVSSSTCRAHLTRDGGSPRLHSYDVAATTLDALVADMGRAPDIVKLDVEGGEFAVLTGAVDVLARDRPDIVIECDFDAMEDGYRQSIELLLATGYHLFHFDPDGQPQPLPLSAVQAHGTRCDRENGFLHKLDNLLLCHPDRPVRLMH